MNTAKLLSEEISRDFKINNRTRRPELPEITTLIRRNEEEVEFSIGWYDDFKVKFNPKTVGVKYVQTNPQTKEHKTISKQYPLEQENLLDTILDLYKG